MLQCGDLVLTYTVDGPEAVASIVEHPEEVAHADGHRRTGGERRTRGSTSPLDAQPGASACHLGLSGVCPAARRFGGAVLCPLRSSDGPMRLGAQLPTAGDTAQFWRRTG